LLSSGLFVPCSFLVTCVHGKAALPGVGFLCVLFYQEPSFGGIGVEGA
jgi:hypothetical protein